MGIRLGSLEEIMSKLKLSFSSKLNMCSFNTCVKIIYKL